MKKKIGMIILIGIAGFAISKEIKAQDIYTYEQALDKAYEAFVIENKDSLTITCDRELGDVHILSDMGEKYDNEEDLFDGYVLESRLKLDKLMEYKTEKGYKYTIDVKHMYDPEDADTLTDKMVEEIKGKYGDSLSERKRMYAITEFMADTYDYDYDSAEQIDQLNNKEIKNSECEITDFVNAYYGDRKIVCTEYAALTYILAKKFGLDCEIVVNNEAEHVYNIVKFSDMDHYIIVDTACGTRNAMIGNDDAKYYMDYYKTGRISKPFTGKYSPASLWEVVKAEAYFMFEDIKEGRWL